MIIKGVYVDGQPALWAIPVEVTKDETGDYLLTGKNEKLGILKANEDGTTSYYANVPGGCKLFIE